MKWWFWEIRDFQGGERKVFLGVRLSLLESLAILDYIKNISRVGGAGDYCRYAGGGSEASRDDFC